MPLTPADVHNVVFKKPPIGKRGYDEDEVDAFLDVVEAELARLIEENNELRAGSGRRPDVPAPVVEAPAPVPGPVVTPRAQDDGLRPLFLKQAPDTEPARRHRNEGKGQAEQ